MSPTLKLISTTAASAAAVVILDRVLPSIAAGLVAIAHELHPASARAEMTKRERSF